MSNETNNPHTTPDKPGLHGEGPGMHDDTIQQVHAKLAHEKEEPSQGFSPVPILLVCIFVVFSFWGGLYLIEYSGDFDPLVYDEHFVKGSEVAERVPPTMAEIGAKVFKQNCVTCHQASGLGVPGAYPSLHGTKWVTGAPELAIAIVMSGLAGPIEVAGAEFNGNMTPFGHLDDKKIAGVITYVRTNAEWGNTASEVTEEMVAAVRANYARTSQWTAGELLEVWPHE